MKTSATTLPRQMWLILVIVLAALALWIPRQRRLAQARLEVAEAEAQRVRQEERVATAAAALESVRRELRAERSQRAVTLLAVAEVEQELARVDPESRWLVPPPALPEWNAESPYVWLRKQILPGLWVSVFSDDGELRGDIAAVLTLTEGQQRALNTTIPRLLAEYRALEAAHAERDSDSPSGTGDGGEKVTVRIKPLPDEGARLKRQLEAALRGELGEQRGELVLQLSADWLNSQFGHFGTDPKTISVTRRPDGTYQIEIQDWNGQEASSGLRWDNLNIPAHLRHLFNDLADPGNVANRTEPERNQRF